MGLDARLFLPAGVRERRDMRACAEVTALAMLVFLIAGGSAADARAQAANQAANQGVGGAFRVAARSLVTMRVDRSRLVTTEGALRPELAAAVAAGGDLGAVDDSLPMEHIQMVLRRTPERQGAFDSQVEALHRPGSGSFHRWLTPETVGAGFGPAESDLAVVRGWLEGEGFHVNGVSKSGLVVDFTATAGQIRASLGTEVHRVVLADGEEHIGAVREAQIPEALGGLVRGFVSMSNLGPKPLVKKVQPGRVRPGSASRDAMGGARPEYLDSSSREQMGAQDFYTIYNELPLLQAATPVNGAGVTIALIEETDITTADVTAFRTAFGVVPNTPDLTVMHGGGGVICAAPGVTSTNEESEAVLDTEWAGAVAPSAKLIFMSCKSATTDGVTLSAESVVDGNLAQVMSLSYGSSEKTAVAAEAAFYSDLWEQAAAEGITVVVSAGDSGSDVEDQNAKVATHGLNVSLLSSTAWNVSAGGTDFQDTYNGGSFGVSSYWGASNGPGNLTALSYVPETTWNGTCASSLLSSYIEGNSSPTKLCDDIINAKGFSQPDGGSGGVSVFNARPSWQTGTVAGLPTDTTFRVQPDVSLFASNGVWNHALSYYQSDTGGSIQFAGGTSFVAPQLAGVFALIGQSTGERLGQPNYVLYSMAGSEFGTTATGYTGGSACNGSGASGVGTTTFSPASTCVFYDVETGNNSQACKVGSTNCFSDAGAPYGLLSTSVASLNVAYSAGAGWDYATGIGSFNITNLVKNWQNPADGGTIFTPTVTVTVTPSGYTYGQPAPLTLTATVAGSGSFPTGSVQFQVNGTNVSSPVALTPSAGCASGGTCTESATLSTTLAATVIAGSDTIGALYAPTNESYANASGSATLLIAQQTPALAVTDASVAFGTAAATLTASLSYVAGGSAPLGAVTIKVDSGATVLATCGTADPEVCTGIYPTGALSAGSHTISAAFAGDRNYAAASGTGRLTVTGMTATNEVWVANGTGTVTALSPAGLALGGAPFSGGGIGIAIDHSGDVWTLNTGANSVAEFSNTGVLLNGAAGAGAGITSPTSLAIDGLGQVWIANGNGTVSVLKSSGAPLWGVAAGGGGISAPTGVTIDISGNVWIANAGNNSVTEILGAAAPVAPLSTSVANDTLGVRP